MDYSLVAINKNSTRPLARQLADLIGENIRQNKLRPGGRLPTERELAERFGVARGTVKAAYRALVQTGLVNTRQGSGSFVADNVALALGMREKEAQTLAAQAVENLSRLGLDPTQIRDVLAQNMPSRNAKTVDVALISDAPELLMDFKGQLVAHARVAPFLFILESITESGEAARILKNFPVIVTPSKHYALVKQLLPELQGRIVKAAISPCSQTLIALTAFPRGIRIGIICRSNVFLGIVKRMLLSYGFKPENIQSFFEMDYTTETYFPGGIDLLISFSGAHIFVDEGFRFRNEKLLAKGGAIVSFQHQIEDGSMIYIMDRVNALLSPG